ncbi:MAG: 30S ribosomal protein S4 [Endomicrobium sp.]|jgi:small subunit ribosomal protein S4|nr:30S ribosomal protein S4 [Endomicrobium sp.]
MSRYLGSVCKFCRREKEKLFLKGEKCFSNCILLKKRGKNVPGQHKNIKNKISDYAVHLREKQKTKRIYGLTEEQFRHYYEIAERMIGSTGENLLKILELRLDNVVFRLGLFNSKKMSRQIINHGNILVNNKKVNMPRYQVKIGDIITVSEKYRSKSIFKKDIDTTYVNTIPTWLNFDKNKTIGRVISEPYLKEILYHINSQLIVEYYSK